MDNSQKNNPLHGITLENMLCKLVDYFDWDTLAELLPVDCFSNEPSIKSSLKFFRKTPWARKKLETLYIRFAPKMEKNNSKN